MDLTKPLSDEEFLLMHQLMQRYFVTELDQFERLRFVTKQGDIFVRFDVKNVENMPLNLWDTIIFD